MKIFFFKIKGELLRILGIAYPLLTRYLSVTIPVQFLDHGAVQRVSQLLALVRREILPA